MRAAFDDDRSTTDAADVIEPTDAGRATRMGSAAVAAVGLGMLSVAAWTGLSVRPAGEDYCAAWRTRDTGFGGIVGYYYTEFSGRVSNAAASAIVFSHGAVGEQLLPSLLVLSLAVGTYVLLRQLLRLAARDAPRLVTASVAVGVTTLLLLGSEARYQVLLWAAGSVTHTLPIVMTVWTLVHALTARRQGRAAQCLSVGLAAVVGFLLGTMSEAAAAVSGILAVAALGVLGPHARRARDWFVLAWPSAWVLGLCVGAVVLRTSPGLASRTETPPGGPALLSPEGLAATVGDLGSTWGTILGHTPAYLGALTLGVVLGLSCTRRQGAAAPRLVQRSEVVPAVAVLVTSLAVVAELRLGYGEHGWRFQRAYTSFLYPTLLTLCFYGALLGQALRGTALRRTTALVAAALTTVGMVSLVPALLSTRDAVVKRASVWDEQSARLQALSREGKPQARYTPYPIEKLSEPFRILYYSNDWVAHCVEHYYRMPSIAPSSSWLQTDEAAAYRRVHPTAR